MKGSIGSQDWLDLSTRRPGIGSTVLARRSMASRATRIKRQIRGWEQAARYAKPPFKQCQHLIRKFGGIVPFAVAVGVHPDEIIRYWLAGQSAPKKSSDGTQRGQKPTGERATGGFIPSAFLPRLIVAARYYGLLLMPEDLYPDFLSNEPANLKDLERWNRSLKKSERARKFEHVLASLASTPV